MNVNGVSNTSNVAQMNKSATKAVSEKSFDSYLDEAKTVSLNDIFEKAAATYDVDVNLLKAIGYTESNFKVNATSHCGAQGIMQLMPATADYLGVKDAYDPEQNIMGGAKYISSLLDKYDGNITLALAAYNAGSGNVAKYGGVPPFKETQNYVVKVKKYMQMDLDASGEVTISSKPTAGTNLSGTVSNYTPVFNEVTKDVVTTSDLLDELFSYEDYDNFLRIFNQDKDKEDKDQNDNTLSQINMNPTISNLLKGI